MVRTLTAEVTTEKDRSSGAYIVRVLKIEWGATPGDDDVYYSSEVLTLPRLDTTIDLVEITTEGRIVTFGAMNIKAEPGQVGGFGQVNIAFSDGDQLFRGRVDTTPGVQNKPAYLYLYLMELGTVDEDPPTWHRVTEFGGTLATPLKYDEISATWSVALKGFEHFEDRRLGVPFDEDTFPEAACEDVDDGAIVPIVFGQPCYRSPCLLVDRPGFAFLRFTFHINDDDFEMHVSASDGKFGDTTQLDEFDELEAVSFSIIVGYPGNFERMTGNFFVDGDPESSDDSAIFNIVTRDAIYATGTSPGTFAEGGFHHFLVSKADLPDDSNRGGHVLFFQDDDDNWNLRIVTEWLFEGTSIKVFVFGKKEKRPAVGAAWKMLRYPGWVPVWPPGTPVYEDTNWKYIANFLPSASIERLEARSTAHPTRGEGEEELFLTYNPTSYTVKLDDRDYNVALGRDQLLDPGVTTFTVDNSPTSLLFAEDRIYATMNAIYDRGAGGDPDTNYWQKVELNPPDGVLTYVNAAASTTALDNPADVLAYIIDQEQLTDIGVAFRDTDSFDSAGITTKAAFAITKMVEFNDFASNLCYEHQSLFFWDQAKIFIKKLDTSPLSSVMTLTNANRKVPFSYEAISIKEHPTVLKVEYQPHTVSPIISYTRQSANAQANYGVHEKTLKFSTIQLPSSAVASLEFWFVFWLGRQRRVSITTYLNALHVQPGDTITLDIQDADGNAVLSNVARVVEIRQTPLDVRRQQQNTIDIVAEIGIWSFAVDPVTLPAGFDTVAHTCRTGSGSGEERAYNFAQLGFPEQVDRGFWNPLTGTGIGGISFETHNTLQPTGTTVLREGSVLVGKATNLIQKADDVLEGLKAFLFQTYLLTNDNPPTWVPDPDEPPFTVYNGSPDADTLKTDVFCAVGFFEVSEDAVPTLGQTDGIWLLLHWLDCSL